MADSGEPAEEPFLYDAFISYRHVDRDRKWAEWLINALERYRVPKALQHRGLPPRLRKVFRDEDELPSSSDLNDQIREALIGSRYLIVVCSAFTPRSKWVEREIEIFNELGRSDQVLALLTEGEPGDSFPDVMLERHREVIDPDGTKRIVKEDKEPLAADVRPRPDFTAHHLKHLALLRLVAVILGVKFDDLRQREYERARKRRLTWAAIAAALVVLIGGGGGVYWNMMRPKTAYFRQLVWRWGLPEGAGKIDAATHDHLARSYSVLTQRGKVVEVRHDGWIRAEADGFARWVIRYGEDGTAQRIEIYSATGRLLREDVLRRESAAGKMIVSFERGNVPFAQEASPKLITDPSDAQTAAPQPKSEITRHELTFDDSGFQTEVRYEDNWGTPQHDAQGSFGEHFIYSPDGMVLRSTEIGPEGVEITLKSGVHAVASRYDGQDRPLQLTLLDEHGNPVNGPDGYSYYVIEYEDWGNGNDTTHTYYGADGKPTLGRNGFSKLVGQFDAHGNNIEVAFYGVDGKRTTNKDGIALIRRKFDARGNVIEAAFFDVNGQPAYDVLSRAGYRETYDERGNVVALNYFGIDGKPAISTEGIAKLTRTFDLHGNTTDESYFGLDGKPILASNGYADLHQTFNDRDQEIEIDYRDAAGKPTLSNEAIASIKFKYDARGNEVERAFFGVDGMPKASSSGYAGVHRAYDERGNEAEVAFFGTDGKPALSKEAIAKTIRVYDARGNEVRRDFFGLDGKPTVGTAGYASLLTTFDDHGRIVDESLFGVDGAPSTTPEGIARTVLIYDARGNEMERDFFGPDGKPTLGTIEYSSQRSVFDDRGNLIEQSYFGFDGKPIRSSLGVASLHQAFDDRHHRTELSYFGVDGKPGLSKEAIAKVTYGYNGHNNEVERAFFGLDGRPTLVAGGFSASGKHSTLAAKS
jgi:hypothetical protein